MNGILDGIKIIDMSRLLPGPFCTQMLSDLGADVIKIEDTNGGDYMRWMPPVGKADSGYFLSLNRNKRSMKLNLRAEEGKSVLLKLAADADVLVEQLRPGTMEKLGLGYETLKANNRRLIMCSITGYGQDGPLSNEAGHEINFLGTTGILDLVGYYEGCPALPGIQGAGAGGGSMWAAFSIMAALFAREKSGKGQYIDVSITDSAFALMTLIAGAYFISNKLPSRKEDLLVGGFAWYQVYKTKDDRYIAIAPVEEKFWEDFCNTIDRPDFISIQHDPPQVQERMKQEISAVIAAKTVDEWLDILGPLNICASKVKNLEEAIADEHLNARGMIIEMDHPVEGKVRSLGFPVKFSEQPYSVRTPPPSFGEHTNQILMELGYTEKEIKEMADKGVI